MTNKWLKKRKLSAYLMALAASLITIAIVANPEEAFRASADGLKVWWEVVLPALLPFFIAAEILMGLGVVHFMGALLEPIMRPLFRVPGVGAFAVSMGLASGYPIGAKITGRLRRDNLCSQVEAERLVSISNTADPIFMIGAVAVGMFHMPQLGIVIALSHYFSSLVIGLIMRFYGNSQTSSTIDSSEKGENIFSKGLRELYRAKTHDGRTFGHLLGDAITDSVNTLLIIGGFITLFSVIIRILTIYPVVGAINSLFAIILSPTGFSTDLITALTSGLFEITIGTELSSKATGTLIQQVMIANAIIAWSGLSVHAQVAAMINGTDIRIMPYIISRVAHAIIAATITLIIFRPVMSISRAIPASTIFIHSQVASTNILNGLYYSTFLIIVILGSLIGISCIFHLIRSIKIVVIRFGRK